MPFLGPVVPRHVARRDRPKAVEAERMVAADDGQRADGSILQCGSVDPDAFPASRNRTYDSGICTLLAVGYSFVQSIALGIGEDGKQVRVLDRGNAPLRRT